jgi:hypothetical protein
VSSCVGVSYIFMLPIADLKDDDPHPVWVGQVIPETHPQYTKLGIVKDKELAIWYYCRLKSGR